MLAYYRSVIILKLTSDSETLAENKVLILYILEKIGKPVSNDSLLNVVLGVTDMNYFYFQQFLLDLLENGYIKSYEKDEHTLYEITDFGKDTLDLTKDLVPGIIKLRVDSNFKSEFDNYVENIKRMSIRDTGVDVKFGDKLVTLSTCAYHVKDGRFAVIGKKIEE